MIVNAILHFLDTTNEMRYNRCMGQSFFTIGNAAVIMKELLTHCNVCGATFANLQAVIQPASNTVMIISSGTIERIFRIIGFQAPACIHIYAMRWMRLQMPLHHKSKDGRCNVILLPALSNPPPIPGPLYRSQN